MVFANLYLSRLLNVEKRYMMEVSMRKGRFPPQSSHTNPDKQSETITSITFNFLLNLNQHLNFIKGGGIWQKALLTPQEIRKSDVSCGATSRMESTNL